eukprot:scaffold30601_cov32-Prasinocladus_malaysianus.AAC.2
MARGYRVMAIVCRCRCIPRMRCSWADKSSRHSRLERPNAMFTHVLGENVDFHKSIQLMYDERALVKTTNKCTNVKTNH